MKQLIAITSMAMCLSPVAMADTSVTVEVTNIASKSGQLFLSVFDNKKSWMKKPVHQDTMTIDEDTERFEIELPPGDYGFMIFHDIDDNKKMKTNFIGIPKEPTAVSNEAKGRFGPPKFKDAVVTIGDKPITVPMKLVSID